MHIFVAGVGFVMLHVMEGRLTGVAPTKAILGWTPTSKNTLPVASFVFTPQEGIGAIQGIGGGRNTCGVGGSGGCGRIPIVSMQQAGNGSEAGITIMMAVRFASLLRKGQLPQHVFAACVLLLQQLASPSFLFLQQLSASLQHFPSLQQSSVFAAEGSEQTFCK